jgi:hypothetical protein
MEDQHIQLIELEQSNARYNEMKNYHAERRKDFIHEQAA